MVVLKSKGWSPCFRFAGASGFSAAGMEGALRTARSYPAERFDEILIRELGRSAKKAAEETAEAESKAQMERFRKLNRLTHELAHHGLPRNIRRWDLSGGEKTVLLSTFCVKLIAFYQDRLGTGPMKNSKSRTFSVFWQRPSRGWRGLG